MEDMISLQQSGYFPPDFFPKISVFEKVTSQTGLAYQVHKNNNDNVVVLEEFYHIMFRVAMSYAGTDRYKGKTPEEIIETYMLDLFQKCTLVMPINKSVLVKAIGEKEGMDEVIMPRERETVHSHLNAEADGTDTLPVRREPLETVIDVEKAAAKKKMAAVVAARLREQEESDVTGAAAMGLSLEEYLRTNKRQPRVRAETPEGETPLNMWRVTPCGDGFWDSAAAAAADSYSAAVAAAGGGDDDGGAAAEHRDASSPIAVALQMN